MPPVNRSSARTALLEAAEDMLREVGMSGAGIKEIAARSGAPIGSLYHYFPGGKTQLVTDSLRIHAGKVPRLMEHFFDGKKNPAAALRALFNAAAEGFERGGANKGCALGAVTLDLTPADTEIRDVCRQAFEQWIAMIAAQLPFADKRSRRSFAVVVVAALEGAFILARAAQSGAPFRDVGECLAAMAPANSPGRARQSARRPKPRRRD
jgi:TetR/AcrR family transcriptional repressor of lmrAB and yxaGH operons